MKYFALILCVASFAQASVLPYSSHGFLEESIVLAEKRRQMEESYLTNGRIVGGETSALGQFPYQAGLVIDIVGLSGNALCGGSLVSANRVVTAAHCWFDGRMQAWRFTVVLGSTTVFSNGLRIQTTDVVTHPSWFPTLVLNDVAVVKLSQTVSFTDTIFPIALPTEAESEEKFVGETAVASGFGLKNDGGALGQDQFLSHVNLNVITNNVCRQTYLLNVFASTICTSGANGRSTCSGDSGGPLAVIRNNKPVLVGITSFGHRDGCELGYPAAFARVTSFLDFFNKEM